MPDAMAALLNLISDPMVIVSGDAFIIRANYSFAEFFGTTPERLVDVSLPAATGLSEADCRAMLEPCCRASGPFPFMASFRNLGGEHLRCRVDGALLERTDSKRTTRIAFRIRPQAAASKRFLELNEEISSLKREVQARHQAEAALRASDEALRKFSNQLENLVASRTRELLISQERLRALATELNLAEQRERKRLATELHDQMAQLLALSKLHLAQARRWTAELPVCHDFIERADDTLTDALTYARTLMHDLSPTVLHEFGLGAALVWLSERMNRHGMAVSIVSSLPSDTRLPEDRAVLTFQCVRELLMNVVKHAGSGRATVAVATEAQRLSIEVRDGGAGFDMQEALKTGGLGGRFGLFSIRERMAAMGGSFDLDSSPGMGTTARLTLPIEPATSASGRVRAGGQIDGRPVVGQGLAALGPAPPAGTGQHMIRVLLVDDHAMMRQGLRSVLEAYSDIEIVGEAGDGEEAIAGTERLRPSIVVMDINMPRMNGIEATSRIKQRFPETIVVGLSVNAAHDNQAAMAQAGASALLTKEAAVDQLYRNIQEALRRSHAPTVS